MYRKNELIVFSDGDLKGRVGKFLKHLDAPHALILVDGHNVKAHRANFMRQSTMVDQYIGFEPLGYITKDGIILGFIDQNDEGYIAVRLDDEGVKLTEPLPWSDRIDQVIKSNNNWWADEPRDTLDYLVEELLFIGCPPFGVPVKLLDKSVVKIGTTAFVVSGSGS